MVYLCAFYTPNPNVVSSINNNIAFSTSVKLSLRHSALFSYLSVRSENADPKRKPVFHTCHHRNTTTALLSEPMLPTKLTSDPWTYFPHIYLSPSAATAPSATQYYLSTWFHLPQPDLFGSICWAVAIYFGFSQYRRWGTELKKYLYRLFSGPTVVQNPDQIQTNLKSKDDASQPDDQQLTFSEVAAQALHVLPFLLSGILIEAFIQNSLGETFALAGGVSTLLWSGVYELQRPKILSDAEKRVVDDAWKDFQEFASKQIKSTASGSCHFTEISTEFRNAKPAYRAKRVLSDSMLKSFIRKYAPYATRTPNDFYKGISIEKRRSMFK